MKPNNNAIPLNPKEVVTNHQLNLPVDLETCIGLEIILLEIILQEIILLGQQLCNSTIY